MHKVVSPFLEKFQKVLHKTIIVRKRLCDIGNYKFEER